MELKVNEIFYTLQGEGARVGCPSIFIRLSHCDKTCPFCDTEFESGKILTVGQIYENIQNYPCQWIVWTGGEPTLQLTSQIVQFFKDKGYKQAIETHGGNKVPAGIDYIAVSPKVAEHVLAQNFPDGVQELRYIRHVGQAIPQPKIKAEHYFISPEFNGDVPVYENIAYCIELVKQHPQWRLSVQMHKFLKIR
ncbi:MAG: 7-carboxy-7-deazaguanine synthase QueE [Bacteroidia bacterium]|nr:7-carboxy-7-deazaguanine synthase QueE [Bacteroidia bacterium]MDW8302117.1 7-carboxy-7-deazaguanine synthase QueE [Bacteroidia bacterium]